jgi:hypothetical protein
VHRSQPSLSDITRPEQFKSMCSPITTQVCMCISTSLTEGELAFLVTQTLGVGFLQSFLFP